MPVTKVKSRWSGGALSFYESTGFGNSTDYDVLTLDIGDVTIGSIVNDVNFKIFMGAEDQYVAFDCGTAVTTFEKTQLTLGTSSNFAVTQGGYIYLDGQGGGEYIRSDTEHYLMLNATTGIDMAIAGTDEYNWTATGADFNANTITDVGDIETTNAAGPTLQNEAATTTNPTLIPNRADETTGIGWGTAEVWIVVSAGAEYGFSVTGLDMNGNALTELGTLGMTGALTISPAAAGTFLDFELEDEWVSGTLIRADFAAGPTTFTGNVVGMLMDFDSNVTAATDQDITAYQVLLPDLDQAVANTTTFIGWNLSTAGAIVQSVGAGTLAWRGINLQLPNITQATGTVTAYGLNITAGTVTSGSEIGVVMSGTMTTGIDLSGATLTNDIVLQNSATITNGGAAVLTITEPTIALVASTGITLASNATNLLLIGNTANALQVTDSTMTFIDLDTRDTVTGVTNVTMTGIPATVAQAAGMTKVLLALVPDTTTITNATGVTAMEGMALNVARPTITSATNPAVAIASTVYIANAPLAAGTATITAGYALQIAAGNMLTGGRIIVDDTTDASSAVTGSIQTDGGIGVAGISYFAEEVHNVSALAAQGLAHPYFSVGTSASSVDLTLAEHVVGFATWFKVVNNAAYTALGGYFKVETDGTNEATNAQLVAVAPRVTVDMNLDSGYGVQSHMTVSGTKTSSELINVSAYTVLGTGARTADRVCALQAMISGSGTAGTVVGDAYVAYLVNAGTVQTTDAICKIYNQSAAETTTMLYIDNDNGTPADDPIGIDIEGRMTHGIRMSNMTPKQGNAYHFIEIGSYASALNLATIEDHVFAAVTNLQATNDSGSAKWIIADYSKITITDANAQPNNSVAIYRPKLALNEGIGNAWGMQLDINCTGSWATNDLIGVGVFLDLGSGTITSTPGKVAAIQADVYGAATAGVTGECYAGLFRGRGNISGVLDAVLQVENQNGSVNAAIGFDMNGVCTYGFLFNGSACDAWTDGTGVVSGSNEYVLIPVRVAGVAHDLLIKAQKTWS